MNQLFKKSFEGMSLRGVWSVCTMIALYLVSAAAVAGGYDIGGPDDGPLAAITAFVQDVVDFVDGPVALAFSFFSIAGLAITWAVAPKMVSAMGMALRVVIACIILLNVGAWILAFQS